MVSPLQKIIDLTKKTDDNFIILDHEGNPSFVIMNFSRYQDLVANGQKSVSPLAGLTEDELLERINRDIAVWKTSQQKLELDHWQEMKPKVNNLGQENEIKTSQISLNQANNSLDSEGDSYHYYFEPID